MEEFARIFSELGDSEMEMFLKAMGIIAGVFLVAAVISLLYGLIVYILQAVGIYSVAKRRGICHPWLAWIPVAQNWVLGSISDQYQQMVKHKTTKRRVIVLVLTIGSVIVTVFFSIFSAVYNSGMVLMLIDGDVDSFVQANAAASLISDMINFLIYGVGIAANVFTQIVLFDVYSASVPDHNVLLLVLGILFPFLTPYFLFFTRKKDEGMRISQNTEPAGYMPPQPQWQSPAEN